MAVITELHLRGTRAEQPDADAVSGGVLYFVSDEGVTEISTESGWEAYSSAASGINQLTGDATAGPGVGSQAITLAASGVTPGTYGGITVDAKGRITAISLPTPAKVLLATLSAATSATLDFFTRNASGQSGALFQSDYDLYEIELIRVRPETDAKSIFMRCSTDGVTFDTSTGNYKHSRVYNSSASSSPAGSNGASDGYIFVVGSHENTAATFGGGATIKLFDPLSAVGWKSFTIQASMEAQDGNQYQMTGGASYRSTSALAGLRFYPESAGNLASGRIAVFGIRTF